jgi:hypothetical protein
MPLNRVSEVLNQRQHDQKVPARVDRIDNRLVAAALVHHDLFRDSLLQ